MLPSSPRNTHITKWKNQGCITQPVTSTTLTNRDGEDLKSSVMLTGGQTSFEYCRSQSSTHTVPTICCHYAGLGSSGGQFEKLPFLTHDSALMVLTCKFLHVRLLWAQSVMDEDGSNPDPASGLHMSAAAESTTRAVLKLLLSFKVLLSHQTGSKRRLHFCSQPPRLK